jgi:hypothetical protein
MDLGDYSRALQYAERAFGRKSQEYVRAQQEGRDARIGDEERRARDLIGRADWEGAAGLYRALRGETDGPRQERYRRAQEYCQALAEGGRLEGKGEVQAALAIYRRLREEGSPHEGYLEERIDSLERTPR